MEERTRIIIDTDMAFGSPNADIDDAVALLFAFASPELDVMAVTAAGGNAAPDKVSRNIDALLSRTGVSVRHSFSSARPLDPEFWVSGRWQSSPEAPVSGSAYPGLHDSVSVMREALLEGEDSKTVVTIGPMTNVAMLLLQYPEMRERISRIVSMGGSIHETGTGGGPAEFNIRTDPEAAAIVLSSGIPAVMFPLDVTKKKRFYPETIAEWKEQGPMIRSLHDAAVAFMEHRARRDGYSPAYSFFHDMLPLVYLAAPQFFVMKSCSVSVDLHGSLTRGVTLFDFSGSAAMTAVDSESDDVFRFAEERIMERFGSI